MRNLLLLFFAFILFGCGAEPHNQPHNQPQNNSYTPCTNFIVNNDFYEVDDDTFLNMLNDALDVVSLTEREKQVKLKEYRGSAFTRIFVRKRCLYNEENIIVNFDALEPTRKLLENIKSELEVQQKSMMPQGFYSNIIESGMSKWKSENRQFNYLYLISENRYEDNHYYSNQYIIDIFGRYYHVIINTQDNLKIEDVFLSVYKPFV